jgi:ferredoxin/flavodoxin---NADP+ reductase
MQHQDATAHAGAAHGGEFPIPAGVFAETVVSVKHYTDQLFSPSASRARRASASAPANS